MMIKTIIDIKVLQTQASCSVCFFFKLRETPQLIQESWGINLEIRKQEATSWPFPGEEKKTADRRWSYPSSAGGSSVQFRLTASLIFYFCQLKLNTELNTFPEDRNAIMRKPVRICLQDATFLDGRCSALLHTLTVPLRTLVFLPVVFWSNWICCGSSENNHRGKVFSEHCKRIEQKNKTLKINKIIKQNKYIYIF